MQKKHGALRDLLPASCYLYYNSFKAIFYALKKTANCIKNTKAYPLNLSVVALILAASLPLQAQTNRSAWSLEQCFEQAEKNNIQLKQAQLQTQSAQINYQQSRANQLPNFNGQLANIFNFGRSIDPVTNSFVRSFSYATQAGVGSQVQLYGGGQLKQTIVQREMELGLARLQTDELNNNLRLNILAAYLQIVLADAQTLVLENQAALTLEQRKRMEKMIAAGAIPAGDILDIDAQVAGDNLNQLNANNAVRSAYLNLRNLLNYYEEPFEIKKPQVPIPDEAELLARSPIKVYSEALKTQPALKTTTMQTQIAEQRKRVAQAGKYPSLQLSTSLSTLFASSAKELDSYTLPDTPTLTPYITASGENILAYTPIPILKTTPFFTQISNNFGGSMTLTLTVPIFNQFQVQNSLRLADIAIQNNLLAEENARNILRQNIEQAYLDARAALERYKSAEANIAALQKSLNYTEKRYNVGSSNAFDYINAQNRLITAQLSSESSKYEFFFRLKILDFYSGKPIAFN